MKKFLFFSLVISSACLHGQIYNSIDNSTFFGEWNSGVPGDSIQVLLSGTHKVGANNGSAEGTYKLKIEGYNNDGLVVYPIHVMDENQKVDFYVRNRPSGAGVPSMFFGGDLYMGDEDDSFTRMEWRNTPGALLAGRAIGGQWDTVGTYSLISGVDNKGAGSFCAVFGADNNVSGQGSIGAGQFNTVSAPSCAVFGQANNVSGNLSLVSGLGNIVTGERCLVTGEDNIVRGFASAAFGRLNVVEGNLGFAGGGNRLRVKSYSEMAVGRYNDTLTTNTFNSWNSDDILFAAGNGSSNTDRNNAFTIMKNGEAHFHKQDQNETAILLAHRDGPKYGGDGDFDFNDRASPSQAAGFVLEHRASAFDTESGGIYGDGDQIHIWSPGDGDRILAVHDEDGMAGGTSERWYIDGSGNPSSLVEENPQFSPQQLTDAIRKVKSLRSLSYIRPQEVKDGEVVNKSAKQLHIDPKSLQKILPELVDTKDNGQQYVKYHGVTVLLTEVVKEQQALIEKLSEENRQLKQENDAVVQRLEKIEKLLQEMAEK